MAKTCLNCGEIVNGRADKKFCDNYCRNQYNNQKNSDANNFMRNINNSLRKNRRILAEVLKDEDMKKIHEDSLSKKGFNFTYFTEIYTTKKGKSYSFVYDLGYLPLDDGWFLIVKRKSD